MPLELGAATGIRVGVHRLLAVLFLLALAASARADVTAAASPKDVFLGEFRTRFTSSDVPGIMALVWLRNADDEAKESIERAFTLLSQQHLVEAVILPRDDKEVYGFTVGGRGYGTDLDVVSVLTLTVAFGGPDGPRFRYMYPLGESNDRLFICPAVRRGG